MSSGNAFAALGHEKKKPQNTEKVEEVADIITTDISDSQAEDAAWTPAVTAKTRRLVPQSSQARPAEQQATNLTSPNKSSQDKKKGELLILQCLVALFCY